MDASAFVAQIKEDAWTRDAILEVMANDVGDLQEFLKKNRTVTREILAAILAKLDVLVPRNARRDDLIEKVVEYVDENVSEVDPEAEVDPEVDPEAEAEAEAEVEVDADEEEFHEVETQKHDVAVANLKDALDGLSLKNADLEKKVAGLQKDKEEFEKTSAMLQKELVLVKKELNIQNQRNDNMAEECQELKKVCEDLNEKLVMMFEICKANTGNITTLMSSLE